MSYLVLARRWRPQTFAEILGQEHVTRTLQNAIRAGRVAHAFLFTGVRGVGKTTAARVLAKALNCEQGPAPEPCNACVHCEEIANGTALDVVEIDGASNTGVDDARAIIENVRYRPAKCRYKIYIVDEVHMLSTSAFNALLKTLEEPPPHVKFIFATTDPHKIPATIQSRCQRYDFKRLPLRLVVQHLREIAAKECLDISDTGLFLLARESEGSMRDAQSLLDQVIAFCGERIADEQILEALGLADRSWVTQLAAALLERDAVKVLEIVDRVHTCGQDLRRFVRDTIEHFRNIAVTQAGAGAILEQELPLEELEQIRKQASTTSFLDTERIFRALLQAEGELGRSPVPKLCLEMHLLRLTMTEPLVALAELSEQLRRLAEGGPRLSSAPVQEKENRTGVPVRHGGSALKSPPPPATAKIAEAPVSQVAHESPTLGEAARDSSLDRIPGWGGFMEFLEQRRRFIAAHLRASESVEWDGEVLRVKVAQGIHYQFLTHGSRPSELEKLASEFFGRRVRVEIEALPRDLAPLKEQEGKSGQVDVREVLQHPAVRKTMEILGAEIREVRERSTEKRRVPDG
ncbi:MAG: DNA polymerase III subunit gamma/tau [Candidatus Binatia bacterium]|nr:MAG: DNA polymerase III subunit gamma/tau [Candidatus Binatia bacterium]